MLFSDKISYLDISKLLFIMRIELNLQSKFLNNVSRTNSDPHEA